MSLVSKYDAKEEKKTLHMIRKLYNKTKLDGSFQRHGGVDGGSGWSQKDSNEYINSLLENAVYNKIINADVECCLRHAIEINDEESIVYFTRVKEEGFENVNIDGNNTSSTVDAFLRSDKRVYSTIGKKKKYFKDFSEDEQEEIMHTEKLDVTTLRRIGVVEMCDLFRRLNKSTQLNAQEHRQARWSPLSSFIRSESNQALVRNLFSNFVFVNSKSFDKRTHEEMVAQLTLKLLNDYQISDLNAKKLNDLYENNFELCPKTQKQILNILDQCSKISQEIGTLCNRTGTRLKKGQLQTLFDVVHMVTVLNNFKILNPSDFFHWFAQKDAQFLLASKKVMEENIEEQSYSHWTTFYNLKSNFDKTKELFEGAFIEDIDRLLQEGIVKLNRSKADLFSWDQKLELIVLQRGKTRKDEDINILDLYLGHLEADHVISVAAGGKTEIENGELMFAADNRKKGSKSNHPHFEHQKHDQLQGNINGPKNQN